MLDNENLICREWCGFSAGNQQEPSTTAGNSSIPVNTSYTWVAFIVDNAKQCYFKGITDFKCLLLLYTTWKTTESKTLKIVAVIDDDSLEACYFSLTELIVTFSITCWLKLYSVPHTWEIRGKRIRGQIPRVSVPYFAAGFILLATHGQKYLLEGSHLKLFSV